MNKKLKLIFIISILINLVFFSLIIVAFDYNKEYIFDTLTPKANGKQASFYSAKVSQFDHYVGNNSDIIFLGDSMIEYCDWNELLGNGDIKNRGIRGDTTDRILKRLDNIIAGAPQKIFIMVGVNDLIRKRDLKTVENNYNDMLSKFHQKLPETKLYVMSILPVNESLFWKDLSNDTITDFNKKIEVAANLYHAKYIDLYSHFIVDNQLEPSLTYDGLHLNGAGYQLWRTQIESTLHDDL
jgi:lysophospholipase L1-like esterase